MSSRGQDAPRPRWDRRQRLVALASGAALLAMVALLVVGLMNRDVGASIRDAVDEGDRPAAPGLELPVLLAGDGVRPAGSTVALSDLRGRTVVVNFWASWCGPCAEEAPVLEEIARRHRGAGDVVVLGVNVQDLRARALAFAADHGIAYPSLRDGGDRAQRDFQLRGLPETFVVDPQGRIALTIPGQVVSAEQVTTTIDAIAEEDA